MMLRWSCCLSILFSYDHKVFFFLNIFTYPFILVYYDLKNLGSQGKTGFYLNNKSLLSQGTVQESIVMITKCEIVRKQTDIYAALSF